MDPGRRRHYADFYDGGPNDRPVLLVHGNCQAEALRVLLAPSVPTLHAVRVPPVHELTVEDLPHLRRLTSRCEVLVSQPVRPDYRDLPIGVDQLDVPGIVVRVPVVRINRLHPFQVIIRDPADPSRPPPVVPYHDLRTLAGASAVTSTMALRDVGSLGLTELARREAVTDVVISDAVVGLGARAAWTINHPSNDLLRLLASRVLDHLGLPGSVGDPGRVLLGGIRAPLEADVLEALELDEPPRTHWLVDGQEVDDDEVRSTQSAWYASNPGVVAAGLARHAPTIKLLGLL